tara:strand:- start:1328 stop:2389 length:1062 start_codon:yes stop_codon:yes gene_type:complete
MKIGFIVGKTNEICHNKELKKITPNKYLTDVHTDTGLKKNQLNVDVAIAMTVKTKFPENKVDIILPKEISVKRLQKNDINFVLGYDYISTIEEEPWVPKFAGPKGQKLLLDIYKNPNSKIFPPFKHQDFIWNKKKYLSTFHRRGVPINPTIFVKKTVTIPKLIGQISEYKWKQFIVKPVGGCEGHGCGFFTTKEIIGEPTKLIEYFVEHAQYYEEFLVQRLTEGFKKYGEIKSFWIDDTYRYAIVTKDVPYGSSIVEPLTDEKKIKKCKQIGDKVHKSLPKLVFNGRKTSPVMTRVDVVCCLDNKPIKSLDYYLNEIEEGGLAGSYTDFTQITFPFVEIMAEAYVRKAIELLK